MLLRIKLKVQLGNINDTLYCLCYYNMSRYDTFPKHDVTIKLHEGNNGNNRTDFLLFFYSGLIIARFQKLEIVNRKNSTSSLCVCESQLNKNIHFCFLFLLQYFNKHYVALGMSKRIVSCYIGYV